MYPQVKNVKPMEDFKIFLEFVNGEKKIFDLSPYLNIGKFSELRDSALFKSVAVHFDSIEWANHLDIDPELLYEKGTTVST